MDPIETWKGEPVILTVANGGAGLVILGRDGRANARIPVGSRFLFVRPNDAVGAKAARGFDEARSVPSSEFKAHWVAQRDAAARAGKEQQQ